MRNLNSWRLAAAALAAAVPMLAAGNAVVATAPQESAPWRAYDHSRTTTATEPTVKVELARVPAGHLLAVESAAVEMILPSRQKPMCYLAVNDFNAMPIAPLHTVRAGRASSRLAQSHATRLYVHPGQTLSVVCRREPDQNGEMMLAAWAAGVLSPSASE